MRNNSTGLSPPNAANASAQSRPPHGCTDNVFSDAGDIAFDIAGIPRYLIKGWCQQTDQSIPPVHKMPFYCGHGACAAVRICRAADHSPGLSNGIDAAFRICSGTEWRPVIEVRATVPLPVPPVPFDRGL